MKRLTFIAGIAGLFAVPPIAAADETCEVDAGDLQQILGNNYFMMERMEEMIVQLNVLTGRIVNLEAFIAERLPPMPPAVKL
jgi:hypothetical protein